MKATIDLDIQIMASQIANEVATILIPLLATQSVKKDDSLLGVKDLAEYIGVGIQWVYERVQLKEIPYIKVGKLLRFRKSDIDTWLDGLKIPPMNSLSSIPKSSHNPKKSKVTT